MRPVQPGRALGVPMAQGNKQSGTWRRLCDTIGLPQQPAEEGRYQHVRTATLFGSHMGTTTRPTRIAEAYSFRTNARAPVRSCIVHHQVRTRGVRRGPKIMTLGYTSKRIEGRAVIVKDSLLTHQPGGEEGLPASLWTGLKTRRRKLRRHWRESDQGFRTSVAQTASSGGRKHLKSLEPEVALGSHGPLLLLE